MNYPLWVAESVYACTCRGCSLGADVEQRSSNITSVCRCSNSVPDLGICPLDSEVQRTIVNKAYAWVEIALYIVLRQTSDCIIQKTMCLSPEVRLHVCPWPRTATSCVLLHDVVCAVDSHGVSRALHRHPPRPVGTGVWTPSTARVPTTAVQAAPISPTAGPLAAHLRRAAERACPSVATPTAACSCKRATSSNAAHCPQFRVPCMPRATMAVSRPCRQVLTWQVLERAGTGDFPRAACSDRRRCPEHPRWRWRGSSGTTTTSDWAVLVRGSWVVLASCCVRETLYLQDIVLFIFVVKPLKHSPFPTYFCATARHMTLTILCSLTVLLCNGTIVGVLTWSVHATCGGVGYSDKACSVDNITSANAPLPPWLHQRPPTAPMPAHTGLGTHTRAVSVDSLPPALPSRQRITDVALTAFPDRVSRGDTVSTVTNGRRTTLFPARRRSASDAAAHVTAVADTASDTGAADGHAGRDADVSVLEAPRSPYATVNTVPRPDDGMEPILVNMSSLAKLSNARGSGQVRCGSNPSPRLRNSHMDGAGGDHVALAATAGMHSFTTDSGAATQDATNASYGSMPVVADTSSNAAFTATQLSQSAAHSVHVDRNRTEPLDHQSKDPSRAIEATRPRCLVPTPPVTPRTAPSHTPTGNDSNGVSPTPPSEDQKRTPHRNPRTRRTTSAALIWQRGVHESSTPASTNIDDSVRGRTLLTPPDSTGSATAPPVRRHLPRPPTSLGTPFLSPGDTPSPRARDGKITQGKRVLQKLRYHVMQCSCVGVCCTATACHVRVVLCTLVLRYRLAPDA